MSGAGGGATAAAPTGAASEGAEAAGGDGAAQEEAARAAPAPEGDAGAAAGADPPATAATTEKALEEARAFSAASGTKVGVEETFAKDLTMAERLRLEPAHKIDGVEVDVKNMVILGKLLAYNGMKVKDQQDGIAYEMYPIFCEKPTAYCAPAVRPKISPGMMFDVVKDWVDHKACYYLLERPPGGSAAAVLVMQKVPKDGDPPGQHPLFVNEYSAMKLLSSSQLPKDDEFEVAGAELVKEWAKAKSLGSKGRGDAVRAKQEEERKRKAAAAAASDTDLLEDSFQDATDIVIGETGEAVLAADRRFPPAPRAADIGSDGDGSDGDGGATAAPARKRRGAAARTAAAAGGVAAAPPRSPPRPPAAAAAAAGAAGASGAAAAAAHFQVCISCCCCCAMVLVR